jgi:curli biogenesis system outer membrane secretion channel CsgG
MKRNPLHIIFLATVLCFFLTSCSSGKKEEKKDVSSQGKTVAVEGMETVKGVNPPAASTAPAAKKPGPTPPPAPSRTESRVSSAAARPSYAPPLSFFSAGFRKKVVILEFENKTSYQEEKIGETVAKRLSERLEATQRVVVLDQWAVSERLTKEGFHVGTLTDPAAMKRAHQSLGAQAFTFGTVTDVSLLSSKSSETSDEEISYATAKVEVRLVDASTGNLLKTFIGRSPIFGTRETGEYNRAKAVLKAIEFSLDDILEGFLRQLDLLEWSTTLAKVEGADLYLNAGKLSGLRVGDVLEVYEPGREIIHPTTKISLGWTTGQLKGAVRVADLFGVDAAVGKVVQGQGFSVNDVVKSPAR